MPQPRPANRQKFAEIADFNLDGSFDLAVTNSGDNDVSILLGKGGGTTTFAGRSASVGDGGRRRRTQHGLTTIRVLAAGPSRITPRGKRFSMGNCRRSGWTDTSRRRRTDKIFTASPW
jgi:hypothetical protein